MSHDNHPVILVTDIGGTNSRFAVFSVRNNQLNMEQRGHIPTDSVNSIRDLILTLLETNDKDYPPSSFTSVVIAAAGPVKDNRFCDPPNIPWKIDREDIDPLFETSKIFLINDFVAQAHSCLSRIAEDALLVKDGTSDPNATIAVLGPGTGLGKGILVKDPESGRVSGIPSEGGHANYPPENEEELAVTDFLKKKHGTEYATMEHMVRGDGLSSIMEFYSGKKLKPEEISKLLEQGQHPEVARMYTKAIATVCRCFSLETLCMGGLFIAGGVLAKNTYLVETPDFIRIFTNSATQSAFLQKVPVRLITSDDSGLWGAAQYGLGRM
jgi:glucokinase